MKKRTLKSIARLAVTLTASAALWASSAAFEFGITAPPERNWPNLGRCMNIGGALDAPNEGDWGYVIRDEDLKLIADSGFSVVRLPVKWSAHTDYRAPYKIEPAFLARVDHIIKKANEYGLKVVLDVHHYDELYANPEAHLDRFTNIWVQLARHYARVPDDKLIFELINEPRDKFSGDIMSNAQNRVLSMVRQSNPTRIVILSGDDWATTKGLKNLYIPPDPNIMVSVHYYDPFKFTHQGASWTETPIATGATWGSEKDIKNLAAYAESLAKWQEKYQVPIYFGEFGVIDNVSVPQRAKWTAAVRSAMEAVNVSWCYWDFATGFHAFDQRRGIWSPLILDALIPKTKTAKATS